MNRNERSNTPIPTIQLGSDRTSIEVLDQRLLPGCGRTIPLRTVEEIAHAISDMVVRGAPLIGVTAAYGIWIAAGELLGFNSARFHSDSTGSSTTEKPLSAEQFQTALREHADRLVRTRPTAVNLRWGVERQLDQVEAFLRDRKRKQEATGVEGVVEVLLDEAERIRKEDAAMCRAIGEHGRELIREIFVKKEATEEGACVNILTHCNAGRLACVEYGTATAPIYLAAEAGIPVHVWVDETRPRLQGAKLTAYELGEAGIPHTIIPDGAAAHMMATGRVDMAIVGCDRMTARGDACNKIGTYGVALAAQDNQIPFYVALPSSTIDLTIDDYRTIPIEERSANEVRLIHGVAQKEIEGTADDDRSAEQLDILVPPATSPAFNPAFDVTPARLITGVITERSVISPDAVAEVHASPRLDS